MNAHRGEAVRRLESLPEDASIDRYFDALKDAIREHYLADPGNPYRQSGRSSGEQRWQESRSCMADAAHRDGTFLDVGCANGLLLESLERWLVRRSIAIEPHGIDFVPELVELARKRLSHVDRGNFHAANVWDWSPPRQYDFVRRQSSSRGSVWRSLAPPQPWVPRSPGQTSLTQISPEARFHDW